VVLVEVVPVGQLVVVAQPGEPAQLIQVMKLAEPVE